MDWIYIDSNIVWIGVDIHPGNIVIRTIQETNSNVHHYIRFCQQSDQIITCKAYSSAVI